VAINKNDNLVDWLKMILTLVIVSASRSLGNFLFAMKVMLLDSNSSCINEMYSVYF